MGGSSNHVADALSRRADLASLGSVAALSSSTVATSIRDRARELLPKDSAAQGLDKVDHQKKAGLLQPLPIPTRPWESVSMDYISGLPKVGDLGSIIVVVVRLSKYATFITAPKHVTIEETAHLFFKHIIKYWGLPKDIVSDRDSHFTGVFWTELFKILGPKLSMSSSYDLQSDGQTERFNSMLEEYLRHFVREVPGESLEADEEVCRSKSPLHRVQCGRPCDGEGPRPTIIEVIKGERSSTDPEVCRSLPIMKRIRTVAYKIELPSWWKIHNVFHVSQLQKYSGDREDDTCNQPSRPQLELTKTKEKVAEAILNH
ncbi:UNVERIFIED_CONTAM: Transposon Tf2-11 polyprotein [Sesamum radiatum]|uniref:Transposon Tf2-11 polyprotein n=1 Tax=Sesamum radiatum TaxID=300843 RepID=A0AAW2L3W1_SESRA